MNPSSPLIIFCCPFLNFLQFAGAFLAEMCLDWGAVVYLQLPCLHLSAPCLWVLTSPAGESVVRPSAAFGEWSGSLKSAPSAPVMVLELSLLYVVWLRQGNTDAASPEKAAALLNLHTSLRCVAEALHHYIRYKSECFVTESTHKWSRLMEGVTACQNVVLCGKRIKENVMA